MPHAQEILVRGPNWTGDLIMASPGFRALRRGFPDARITLHVLPGLMPLVAGSPWFDAVLPFESHGGGVLGQLREGRSLAAHGPFDLGVCLPDSFSAAFVMRAAGVAHVVGYRRGWRRALLHQAVALPEQAGKRLMIPREQHVLGLIEAAGAVSDGTHLELYTTPAEEAEARACLDAHGVSEGDDYVVLAPGASYGPSKCWPAASFARAGDELASEGVKIVVVGTPAERPLTAEVVAGMETPAADLAGSLSLGSLKAVLRHARALVANDAGARHVAVAFGVPCVILMGPTALEKTNLNLERVTVLTADVDCRPCYQRECPIDHRCMTRISPERAVAETVPALRDAAGFRGEHKVVTEGAA